MMGGLRKEGNVAAPNKSSRTITLSIKLSLGQEKEIVLNPISTAKDAVTKLLRCILQWY